MKYSKLKLTYAQEQYKLFKIISICWPVSPSVVELGARRRKRKRETDVLPWDFGARSAAGGVAVANVSSRRVNVILGFSLVLLDFLDFGAVGKAPCPEKNRSGTPEVAETACLSNDITVDYRMVTTKYRKYLSTIIFINKQNFDLISAFKKK